MYQILIVDDDKTIRSGLMQIIKDYILWEYELFQAENGQEALTIIAANPIDLVVADIKMEMLDGIEMLKILKDNNVQCEVVMLSGYDDYSLVRNAMKLGAFDYLLKPVNIPVFVRILNDLKNIQKSDPAKTTVSLQVAQHLESRLPEYTPEDFFDLEPSEKIARSELSSHLKKALEYAVSLDETKLITEMGEYFTHLSPEAISVDEVRNELTRWVYDLMQKNNLFIKIIADSKLTDYDLLNSIKGLPTLSQLKTKFCQIISINLGQLKHEMDNYDDYLVRKAKQYISLNYNKNICLNSIAEHLFIHPNYFSTLFSAKTKTTFRDYLRNLRIEKAKEMIEDRNYKVSDISSLIGYQDVSHFIRAFKEVTSMTPSQFKRIQENSNQK